MKNRKAITLIELCIVIVLMSIISFSIVNIIGLSNKSKEGTFTKVNIADSEALFLDQLTEAVRTSTTQFTMPKNSFINEKMTPKWDYLGIMEDVHIPAVVSATGEEIASTRALVYVQYQGTTRPTRIPDDCNLIERQVEGDSGMETHYFLQKILGHDFVDKNGVVYTYTLVFYPTDETNIAAQTVNYDFKLEMKDQDGNVLGEPVSELKNLIATVNSIQIVYRGSTSNPATGLAFRSDYIPSGVNIDKGQQEKPSTIFMILDISGSMKDNSKITHLKSAANTFITKLSGREKVKLVIIPFSSKATHSEYGDTYSQKIEAATNEINNLKANGATNTGGAFRVAYYIANKLANDEALGDVVTIFISDGKPTARDVLSYSYKEIEDCRWEWGGWHDGFIQVCETKIVTVNSHTCSESRDNYPCNGDTGIALTLENSNLQTTDFEYCGGSYRNPEDVEYLRYWGQLMKQYMNPALTYLIDVNGGMESVDKTNFYNIFGVEVTDVSTAANSQLTFDDIFDKITSDLEAYLWAFDGPEV